jgi:hypothetical protein
MMHSVSTIRRLIARSANDREPIQQFDALCDQCGAFSTGWTTQTGAQIAADQHQATAAYDARASRR